MSRVIVKAQKTYKPVGPYNQAVKVGNLLYTAGQIPLDPKTGNMIEGGITEQARQALTNLKGIVEDGGSKLDNVVKTTVFLKNMGDFAAMNAVYSEFFKIENAPARSTVEVARLPKDALVEIECVALI